MMFTIDSEKTKIFVTGFHRAGGRMLSRVLAEKHNLLYVREEQIGWVSMCHLGHKDGVIHCPGLAHKVPGLHKLGEVYWVDRDTDDLVDSMFWQDMEPLAKHVLRDFGVTDFKPGRDLFLQMIKVKRQAFNEKFKDLCNYVKLENQPYYVKRHSDDY